MKNSWKCEVCLNYFTKTCLTNNYFSCDPHFVILAWVQSWNIFEKLMKVWSLPEFFHKNMSHEQLLFTWSKFRDSSMGTNLKYFEKLMKVCSPPETTLCLAAMSIKDHLIKLTMWWQGAQKLRNDRPVGAANPPAPPVSFATGEALNWTPNPSRNRQISLLYVEYYCCDIISRPS